MLRLLPDEGVKARLKILCDISSKVWKEINYAMRRQFFETKKSRS